MTKSPPPRNAPRRFVVFCTPPIPMFSWLFDPSCRFDLPVLCQALYGNLTISTCHFGTFNMKLESQNLPI